MLVKLLSEYLFPEYHHDNRTAKTAGKALTSHPFQSNPSPQTQEETGGSRDEKLQQ